MALFQVSGEGSRPTYFEMAAAYQLPDSLKSAVRFSLGVLAQRQPRLHRVLDHGDEVLAALHLLLEWHSLRTNDASFGESLFALKRERHTTGAPKALTRRQRALSLLFLVGVPYIKAKLEYPFNQRRQQALASSLWSEDSHGDGDGALSSDRLWGAEGSARERADESTPGVGEGLREGLGEGNGQMEGEVDGETRGRRERAPGNGWWVFLQQRLMALGRGASRAAGGLSVGGAAASAYPWLHAQYEGLLFLYQLLYMLDTSPFYCPSLQLLSLVVRRSTPDELSSASSRVAQRRHAEYSRLPGPPALKAIFIAVLRATYTVLDYSQTAIISAVFLFKMLEWWHTTGEQRLTSPTVYPPPPPPPPPQVAMKGLPLPRDKRLCPLCLKHRTNPTAPAVSGFVFCYPCIFAYVDQYKQCPVTHLPTDVSHLRRLYHNA